MLLGGEARQQALKAEGGRLATQALAIATVLVCTGAFAGWRYFSSQTGVQTPGGNHRAPNPSAFHNPLIGIADCGLTDSLFAVFAPFADKARTSEEFRVWAEGTLAKEGGVTQEAARRVADLAGTVSGYTPNIHQTTTGQIVREVSVGFGGVGGRKMTAEEDSNLEDADPQKGQS